MQAKFYGPEYTTNGFYHEAESNGKAEGGWWLVGGWQLNSSVVWYDALVLDSATKELRQRWCWMLPRRLNVEFQFESNAIITFPTISSSSRLFPSPTPIVSLFSLLQVQPNHLMCLLFWILTLFSFGVDGKLTGMEKFPRPIRSQGIVLEQHRDASLDDADDGFGHLPR